MILVKGVHRFSFVVRDEYADVPDNGDNSTDAELEAASEAMGRNIERISKQIKRAMDQLFGEDGWGEFSYDDTFNDNERDVD
jgi:hypothetical protein